MVVVVMVMMVVAVVATAAMPATAMMPATAAMATAEAAAVMAAAMAVTGLGARQRQPGAKPRSGILLVHLTVIDIHAQADRKGKSGYSVFNSTRCHLFSKPPIAGLRHAPPLLGDLQDLCPFRVVAGHPDHCVAFSA
jgi:type II secretory pathway pseudopilin PulG